MLRQGEIIVGPKFFNLRNIAILLVILSAFISTIWLITRNAQAEAIISLLSQFVTLFLLIEQRS